MSDDEPMRGNPGCPDDEGGDHRRPGGPSAPDGASEYEPPPLPKEYAKRVSLELDHDNPIDLAMYGVYHYAQAIAHMSYGQTWPPNPEILEQQAEALDRLNASMAFLLELDVDSDGPITHLSIATRSAAVTGDASAYHTDSERRIGVPAFTLPADDEPIEQLAADSGRDT